MNTCTERTIRKADAPLVWFVAGAGTAVWWLRNPNSKLFWFAVGAGAATWLLKTPQPDLEEWRKRKVEASKRRREEKQPVSTILFLPHRLVAQIHMYSVGEATGGSVS